MIPAILGLHEEDFYLFADHCLHLKFNGTFYQLQHALLTQQTLPLFKPFFIKSEQPNIFNGMGLVFEKMGDNEGLYGLGMGEVETGNLNDGSQDTLC